MRLQVQILSVDVRVASAFRYLSDVVYLLGDVAGLLEVVHGQVAVGVVLALLGQKQVALVGRELHASDMLDHLWQEKKIHLSRFEVSDSNMLT